MKFITWFPDFFILDWEAWVSIDVLSNTRYDIWDNTKCWCYLKNISYGLDNCFLQLAENIYSILVIISFSFIWLQTWPPFRRQIRPPIRPRFGFRFDITLNLRFSITSDLQFDIRHDLRFDLRFNFQFRFDLWLKIRFNFRF